MAWNNETNAKEFCPNIIGNNKYGKNFQTSSIKILGAILKDIIYATDDHLSVKVVGRLLTLFTKKKLYCI